ncbi:MAG: zf-HC2 domain-containing protein [Acidobacteriota bacterium]
MNRHLTSEQLSAHLDGEVGFQESREIQSHLASCEDCRDRYQSMKHTVSAVWRLERSTPPAGLSVRVRAEVAAASRPHTPVRDFLSSVFGLATHPVLRTGAAMGLAFVLSLVVVGDPHLPLATSQEGTAVVTVQDEAPLVLPETTSKVAGREFVWTELNNGDVWVQKGLEGMVPEARLSAQSPQGRELLAKYSDLGLLLADGSRVVLRYGLETVELSRGV